MAGAPCASHVSLPLCHLELIHRPIVPAAREHKGQLLASKGGGFYPRTDAVRLAAFHIFAIPASGMAAAIQKRVGFPKIPNKTGNYENQVSSHPA
jgi:hypothetical protein